MSMNDLFYILQETDLNNQELYLPPDTPYGKINPQRLKALLKKHHARQRERLLNQQVAELDDYQKDFANKNKEDIFITQTEIACELMSGPDFLIECNDQIMKLLSMIPAMSDTTTDKDTEMSELTDSVVPEEKALAPPPPPLPSDDNMDTSEDEEDSLTDMAQNTTTGSGGGGCDDDEAIHQRKMKYSSIIKKKYKKGFARLRKLHEAQLKKLQDIQKEDVDAIAERTPPPPLPPPPPLVPVEVTAAEAERHYSPVKNTKEQSPRLNGKEKQKQLERGRVINEQQREASSTAQQTVQQLLKTVPRDHDRSNANKRHHHHHQHKEGNMPWKQPSQPKSHTNKILDVSTASKSPPTVASSKPPTVATARPPTVATAGPPIVATAGPPVVQSSNRSGNNNNKNHGSNNNNTNNHNRGKSRRGRRDSNQPLFDTKPITFKPYTLLGDTTGSIYIKNKPDRVIINGQDYGSPKDFDDAINGIQRHDNHIFKRHLAGDTYLYYKPSAGQFVALGKVSRIQPFIQKFLLSK